jgi:hypothetical protein
MATKPTAGQHITYGKTGRGKAPRDPSRVRVLEIDTSDLVRLDTVALDTRKPAFAHLDSRKWRRDGRHLVPLVSDTPGDNLETRHLRKLEVVK